MCFFVEKKNWRMKTAKRGIVVYKKMLWEGLGKTVESKFYPFPYELGRLYKTRFGRYHKTINVGFHSYLPSKARRLDRCTGDDVMVRGCIPRGAHYYKNEKMGEYVSNQIVLKEIIRH